MVFIGVDFGDKRVGIAKSDGVLATAVCSLCVDGISDAAAKVALQINSLGGSEVIIGLPKNMDSSEGPRARRTRRFGEKLKQLTGIDPIYFDERLTTAQAYVYMNETDFKSKKRKSAIDALSAKIILQGYLDQKRSAPPVI